MDNVTLMYACLSIYIYIDNCPVYVYIYIHIKIKVYIHIQIITQIDTLPLSSFGTFLLQPGARQVNPKGTAIAGSTNTCPHLVAHRCPESPVVDRECNGIAPRLGRSWEITGSPRATKSMWVKICQNVEPSVPLNDDHV